MKNPYQLDEESPRNLKNSLYLKLSIMHHTGKNGNKFRRNWEKNFKKWQLDTYI